MADNMQMSLDLSTHVFKNDNKTWNEIVFRIWSSITRYVPKSKWIKINVIDQYQTLVENMVKKKP